MTIFCAQYCAIYNSTCSYFLKNNVNFIHLRYRPTSTLQYKHVSRDNPRPVSSCQKLLAITYVNTLFSQILSWLVTLSPLIVLESRQKDFSWHKGIAHAQVYLVVSPVVLLTSVSVEMQRPECKSIHSLFPLHKHVNNHAIFKKMHVRMNIQHSQQQTYSKQYYSS